VRLLDVLGHACAQNARVLGSYMHADVTASLLQKLHLRRWNSGNARYHSEQSLLSSRLSSKNVKITIHWTIILPMVQYECETWSLTLREGV
jgi:hypothetical protein